MTAGAVALAGIMAASAMMSAPVAAAPEQELQSVDVQLTTDGAVQSVATTSTTMDSQGAVTTSSADVTDPAALADLPIRVQTSWWAGTAAGNDLSQTAGLDDPVQIQIDLQNLTLEPADVAFEMNGVRYRRVELVGVPLTVVATANLGEIPLEAVVQTSSDPEAPVTDGIVSLNSAGEVQVQWARILAPPMLPASSSFQLVVDSDDFVPPSIDIAIQPGMVTDPSTSALMASAFGADGNQAGLEESTLGVVLDVRTQLGEANEFLDTVHAALEGDVSQLTSRIVADLRASSESVLGQLEGTNDRLESLQSSFTGSINSLDSQTQSSMTDLANQLSGLLGSTSTTPAMTPTSLDGCAVTLPQLAPGEQRTVASAVRVLDAQLEAIQSTFSEDDSENGSNCRLTLVESITASIGNPADLANANSVAACLATPVEERTVSCAVYATSVQASEALNGLAELEQAATDDFGDLDINSLMAPLRGEQGLAASLGALSELAATTDADLDAWLDSYAIWVEDATEEIDAAKAAVVDAQTLAGETGTAITNVRTAYDTLEDAYSGDDSSVARYVRNIVNATDNAVPVGQWFAASGLTGVIDSLILATTCDATWGATLTEASTLDEITAALAVLDTPDCELAELAQSATVMAESHDVMVADFATANGNATEIDTLVVAVEDALAALDTEITALEDAGTEDLAALLTGLYTPEVWEDAPVEGEPPVLVAPATGLLVDIQSRIDAVAEDMAEEGDLDAIRLELESLGTAITTIWPDNTVQPLEDTGNCPVASEAVVAPGQSVIAEANRLFCLEGDLEESLAALDTGINNQIAASAVGFDSITGRAQEAYDEAGVQVGSAGDALVDAVGSAREAAFEELTGLINAAGSDTEGRLDAALAEFGAGTAETMTELAAAMEEAGAESSRVASTLATEFTTLATNLGSADPNNQVGMLGKLNTITAQVGATGDDLSAIDQNVAGFAASRKGSLRDLGLASAQYDYSLELLESYRPFGASAENSTVVFLYHIPGGN